MTESGNLTPIFSEFSRDPDMAELVDMFVDELPGRLAQIRAAWAKKDVVTLRTIAHQLRGASSGYGFSSLGTLAGHLEDTLRNVPAETNPPPAAESIVASLTLMCSRVIASGAHRAA